MIEHRKHLRLNTHIVLEMVLPGGGVQYHGFIENLCEGGMGVIALDQFRIGTQVYATFHLPGTGERINPKASVLHSRQAGGEDRSFLPYMGFRFDSISDRERASIRYYVETHNITA